MNSSNLSEKRLKRLRMQGYTSQSKTELQQLAFGIRFAYRVCTSILLAAIITQSTVLFAMLCTTAAFGVLLPNHPFDYIYNHFLSQRMGAPQLPPRSPQLKFACAIATLWLAAIIYLMTIEMFIAATVLAIVFADIALLVSITDICIPSIIYQAITTALRESGKPSKTV